jgi:CheY-like chemotaxis protein
MPVEIKDETLLFEPISDDNISIAILVDKKNTFVANHIARYLMKVGVNTNNVKLINNIQDISKNATHIIVFESMLESSIFTYTKKNTQALLVVEENFLGLKTEDLEHAMLVSKYAYFTEALYSFASTQKIPKVLIVEDDKISTILLTTILEEEYCSIDTAQNGEEGLKLLTQALRLNMPYDIVYTDHNMPLLSGSDMLREYCILEKKVALNPITSVCISGETEEKNNFYNFDIFATKPFKKQEIISIFLTAIQNKIPKSK